MHHINKSAKLKTGGPITQAQRRLMRRRQLSRFLAALSLVSTPIHAADAGASAPPRSVDVMDMDLESLMNIQVTSVSKRPEDLSDAAAAIYVITSEDIRRSGATSIPEALRLSPGLEVARQDAHTWAISSRGFNDEFASQMLVLIDGRSVYSPLFSGVYWDVQDLVLEDIDRIEVIRGPGGTLWGANAVNGVINITTKSAKETQGLLVTAGGGNEERGFGAVRYGVNFAEDHYLRIYTKYFNRDESALLNGDPANDSWYMARGGFRYDWIPNDENMITLQGDIYGGEFDQTVAGVTFPTAGGVLPTLYTDDGDMSGGNILSRWTHQFSEDSEFAVKLYYDRTSRDRVLLSEVRDTFDIDLQHQYRLGLRNNIVWGVGYNITSDKIRDTDTVVLDPSERTTSLYSAFIQDEITVIEDRLRLTLGSKLEHNDYTGWELQPSGRLSLSITDRQTAWFAVSRAISTPSRVEDDVTINRFAAPGTPPAILRLIGSREMDAKDLVAFELGYRIQPHDRVSFDLATFYNLYDNQRSLEAGTPFPAPDGSYVVVPYTIGNRVDGEVYGFELATTWQAADWWRLKFNYTFWKTELEREAGSTDDLLSVGERDTPRHQVGVRSLMDLPYNFEFDTGIRYVDALPSRMRFVTGSLTDGVPSYFVADARVGWRPNENWEVSLVAQNLLDSRHQEYAPSFLQQQVTQVETSIFAKITYRY